MQLEAPGGPDREKIEFPNLIGPRQSVRKGRRKQPS